MKIIFYLASFFLLGCTTHKTSTHVALADQQMHSFVKEIYKEKGLRVVGAGGSMMDQISAFSLAFECYDKRLSVPEARKLIVEVIEKFCKEVNANEKIRPYLSNYPINEKNIEFDIVFYEQPHKRVPDDFVAMVLQCEGILYYSYFDAKEQRYKNGDYRERYEEALKIVKLDAANSFNEHSRYPQ